MAKIGKYCFATITVNVELLLQQSNTEIIHLGLTKWFNLLYSNILLVDGKPES